MKKLLIVLVIILFATAVHARDLKISWQGNTEQDLAGYKVYCAQPGDSGWTNEGMIWNYTGEFTHVIDVGNAVEYIIPDIIEGAYAACVTAYDTSGNESDYSEVGTIYYNDRSDPAVPSVVKLSAPITITIIIEGQ